MEHYLKIFENTLKNKWDKGALCDRGGIRYTYGEVAGVIMRLHYLFRETGLKPGDKVALCGKNSSNWAITFVSVNSYRTVCVPLLNDFHPESIAQLTDHADSKVLFIDEDLWKKVQPVGTKVPLVISLKDFSVLECKDDAVSKGLAVAEQKYQLDFPKGPSASDINFPDASLDELAIINYTSGTTSTPKGVMLTNMAVSSNVRFIIDNIKGDSDDKVLSMLPMAHMYGMAVEFLFPLTAGYELHFLGKAPTPRILLDALADVRPFILITVPLVMEKIFYSSVFPVISRPAMKTLLKVPFVSSLIYKKIYDKLMTTFGGKVRHIIMGGAPLNEAVEIVMKKVGLPYCVGYGMTECAPLICYEHYSRFAPRSCGKPVDRMEVRIDSSDPQNVVGEIQTRGANVMKGYYKNSDATASAFTADGWLRTGDMGIMDKEGNVFIKGRCKNMILSANGQNIYPEEIEDKLNCHPAVIESLAVDRGGKVVALVYPDTEKIISEYKAHNAGKDISDSEKEGIVKTAMDELMATVNASLPSYSKITRVEVMATEFEKTPKKSIRRFLYE